MPALRSARKQTPGLPWGRPETWMIPPCEIEIRLRLGKSPAMVLRRATCFLVLLVAECLGRPGMRDHAQYTNEISCRIHHREEMSNTEGHETQCQFDARLPARHRRRLQAGKTRDRRHHHTGEKLHGGDIIAVKRME